MIYLIAEWVGRKLGRFVLWCRWVPVVMTCRHVLKRGPSNECEINTYEHKTYEFGNTTWNVRNVVRHRDCSIDNCPKLNRQK